MWDFMAFHGSKLVFIVFWFHGKKLKRIEEKKFKKYRGKVEKNWETVEKNGEKLKKNGNGKKWKNLKKWMMTKRDNQTNTRHISTIYRSSSSSPSSV